MRHSPCEPLVTKASTQILWLHGLEGLWQFESEPQCPAGAILVILGRIQLAKYLSVVGLDVWEECNKDVLHHFEA